MAGMRGGLSLDHSKAVVEDDDIEHKKKASVRGGLSSCFFSLDHGRLLSLDDDTQHKKTADKRGGLSRLLSLDDSKALVEDDIGELQEEDVWYNNWKEEVESGSNSKPKKNLNYSFGSDSSTTFAWAIPTDSKVIASAISGGSGHQEPTPTKVVSSSPMRIQDWSKIYKPPIKEFWGNNGDKCGLKEAFVPKKHANIIDDFDPLDDWDEFIPPHVLLARREAATRPISHSISLKGKDLIKLRNAIFKLNGYIELEFKHHHYLYHHFNIVNGSIL